MAASGVGVKDECYTAYQDLKLGRKLKYIIYKISDNLKEVEVEKTGEGADYDEFLSDLPQDNCRYAVYDFEYTNEEGGKRSKIVFYTWSPDVARIKMKMIYAATKEAIKKKLDGIYVEIQCTDLAEASYETVLEKVNRK
ncbi:hypothetical protein LY90DRAFT_522171 [Neocallimastix californiae]|jgi:cofilin|uniref:Cofilin n=1 Tax=Neocallimastix californiae TaxID=1754190 RepID=A0A1Y2FJ70_9FUNG|nr:hypothetical protein LY90DRAFT_522171 [Neocallimastix californiae]|eukprot:ORY83434.1 hypothetical protein LY90DRAFT_522171 [Neocallimastix californiae]